MEREEDNRKREKLLPSLGAEPCILMRVLCTYHFNKKKDKQKAGSVNNNLRAIVIFANHRS